MLRKFLWIPLFIGGAIVGWQCWSFVQMLALHLALKSSASPFRVYDGAIASAFLGMMLGTAHAVARREDFAGDPKKKVGALDLGMLMSSFASLFGAMIWVWWEPGSFVNASNTSTSALGWLAGIAYAYIPTYTSYWPKSRPFGHGAAIALVVAAIGWGSSQVQAGNTVYVLLAAYAVFHLIMILRLWHIFGYLLRAISKGVSSLRKLASLRNDVRIERGVQLRRRKRALEEGRDAALLSSVRKPRKNPGVFRKRIAEDGQPLEQEDLIEIDEDEVVAHPFEMRG